MQDGDEEETCVVYQVEYPPQGRCKSVIEALITSNNVHEEDAGFEKVESHSRVYGGLRSHTLEELTEFWQVWSEYDRRIELRGLTFQVQHRGEGGGGSCHCRPMGNP